MKWTHLLEIFIGHRELSLQVAADVFVEAGQDRCGSVVVVVAVVDVLNAAVVDQSLLTTVIFATFCFDDVWTWTNRTDVGPTPTQLSFDEIDFGKTKQKKWKSGEFCRQLQQQQQERDGFLFCWARCEARPTPTPTQPSTSTGPTNQRPALVPTHARTRSITRSIFLARPN